MAESVYERAEQGQRHSR